MGAAIAATPTVVTPTKAKVFSNCTKMHKVYPHGVGKSSKVRDRNTRGKVVSNPVTNFKVSKAIYLANTKSDRDKDGIACEAH